MPLNLLNVSLTCLAIKNIFRIGFILKKQNYIQYTNKTIPSYYTSRDQKLCNIIYFNKESQNFLSMSCKQKPSSFLHFFQFISSIQLINQYLPQIKLRHFSSIQSYKLYIWKSVVQIKDFFPFEGIRSMRPRPPMFACR